MSAKPPPRVAKKAPPPKKAIEPPQAPPPPETPADTKAKGQMPFLPVTQMPTTSDAVLNNMLARELKKSPGPAEPPSENLVLLQTLATGLSNGDISSVREQLTKKSLHQVEKAQVIETVLNETNIERLVNWSVIQYSAEKLIKKAVESGEMTTAEAVVVWRMSQDVLPECHARLEKTKPVDSVSVIEKIDIQAQKIERSVQEKWMNTSPQGREIIRKKLHAFKKQLAAVGSKTGATPKSSS